ncbi:hypothetical protein ACNTMW_00510 [Planosporangium sp. 12N6]|uniref:hypothetical protein n=1 Tax=Planosporangium spinosum TaxID=3402278 RepID=UPI003CEF373A
MVYTVVPVALASGLLGFVAGLFSFKVKSRWCPMCGATLTCPGCRGSGAYPPGVRR